MKKTELKIDRKTLCEISGLTDRRHRQMVVEGILPPLEKNSFPLVATMKGLLAHYQTMNSELREKKLHEEIRKLQIQNDTKMGKLQEVAPLAEWLGALLGHSLANLEQKLINELPGLVEGLDAPQVRIRSRKIFDQFKEDMKPMGKKFAEGK